MIDFFKDIIAPSTYLYNYLEDQNLYWIADLPLVNTFLLKMFKNLDIKDSNSLKFLNQSKEEDLKFGIQLLNLVISKKEDLLTMK